MPQIQKTSPDPDPGWFYQDPDWFSGSMSLTSDTKSMNTKNSVADSDPFQFGQPDPSCKKSTKIIRISYIF